MIMLIIVSVVFFMTVVVIVLFLVILRYLMDGESEMNWRKRTVLTDNSRLGW